ncbi:MAG: Lrp/AsnC family transcriptional regulator [Pseudomonadota bacterium]
MKKRGPHRKTENIDKIDCKIINLLQKDGRLPNTTISKKLGISESTVRTRLNRLIKEEFIQIVAVSNPIKLGFQIVGNIRMHVDIKKTENVIRELSKLDSIWFIVQTTGGTDIYSEFIVKSLDELNSLAFDKINKIDGIIRTDTSLILKFIKRRYDWGTAFDYREGIEKMHS